MRIELLTPRHYSPYTGIGRYVHTLINQYYRESVDVNPSELQYLPLTDRFSPLKQLPVGIEDHVPGSIVHFPQIMGCGMMLWRPYHPSVVTVHDLGVLELPAEWEMLDSIARPILRLSLAGLKRVDKIVAVSEFTRQGVIKHLDIPPERVVTIHSGIDHTLFRPIPNARRKLIHRYPELQPHAAASWLLYVGSELPRKNVGGLLEALALLLQEVPNVRLIKVGAAGGSVYRKETLHTVDTLRLREHVFFFEDIPEEELPLFYSAADVFVTVSWLEGFGFPVLEAMACGTPVICSQAGALQEIAGNETAFFTTLEPAAVAQQLRTILEQTDRLICQKSAGIQHVRRFDWATTASELLALYQKLDCDNVRRA